MKDSEDALSWTILIMCMFLVASSTMSSDDARVALNYAKIESAMMMFFGVAIMIMVATLSPLNKDRVFDAVVWICGLGTFTAGLHLFLEAT